MTFTVIGCGVRGAVAAALLTAAGAERIQLVDGDWVKEEDFATHPLLFRPDLGASRAEALVGKLAMINPDVHVEPFPAFVEADNAPLILAGTDCALDCRHESTGIDFLAETCRELEISLIVPPKGYDAATVSTAVATAVGALQAELALSSAETVATDEAGRLDPVVRVESLPFD